MTRTRVAVACALALAAGALGASAAPVPKHLMPKDEPLLFPTKVGAKHVSIWAGKDLVEEVSKVTPVEGGFEVETETVSDDGTRKHCQTVVASKRGILWTHYEGKNSTRRAGPSSCRTSRATRGRPIGAGRCGRSPPQGGRRSKCPRASSARSA